ncbi:MAG: Multicopper oxidase, partial [uncultured Gemmatimonadaceae bacterium]
EARAEGPRPLHERGDDDPPDAPARHADDGDRQGRVAAAAAVEVRHAQHRPRRAVGRDRRVRQPGHVGLPLPHPAARRERARDVRDGHRADRGGSEGEEGGV